MLIDECIKRIGICYDFGSLYSLEEELESLGIVLRETNSRKVVLCRVEDGKPVYEKMADDFIFVGSYDYKNDPIPDLLKRCVVEFITSKASDEKAETEDGKSWNSTANAFGPPLFMQDEDVKNTMQDMAVGEHSGNTESNLLEAIGNWLNNS